MTVILDTKDLAELDQDLAASSQVWELLKGGASAVTEADFVGVKEVRINKMTGFSASQYQRNADNGRKQLSIEKETVKLNQERFFAYDLDAREQEESKANSISNAVEQHTRLVTIPEKDKHAVSKLLAKSGKLVKQTVTTDNVLAVFDEAKKYMTDQEVSGGYIMFVSSDYYMKLKNSKDVFKTFNTNAQLNINGVNRTVTQLDTDVYVQEVASGRLQTDDTKQINFILVPLNVASPVEKLQTVDLVPASQDRNGYRDTVKGLNYYELIVTDNASVAIYVSYDEPVKTV